MVDREPELRFGIRALLRQFQSACVPDDTKQSVSFAITGAFTRFLSIKKMLLIGFHLKEMI